MADNLLLSTNEFVRFEQELACYIGLNEAIILQKLHRLLQLDDFGQRDDNGTKWVRMTIEEWAGELPFLDAGQIKRALKNIITDGLMIAAQFTGRSNWYTVVYDAVSRLDGPVDRLQEKRDKRKKASDSVDRPQKEDDSNDGTLHNVSVQNELIGQNEPIQQFKMNQCIGSKWTASNNPSNNPSNTNTPNARAQEKNPEQQEQPGPLTIAVLDICKQDFAYVSQHRYLKPDLLAVLEFLGRKSAAPDTVYDFDKWRRNHHWSKNGPPRLSQMGEFWGIYEDWIRDGRPEPTQNGGNANGHSSGKQSANGYSGKGRGGKARHTGPTPEQLTEDATRKEYAKLGIAWPGG